MRRDGMTRQELDVYTKRLIRKTEADRLIPAPAHMKQEILERSRRLDYQLRIRARQIPKKLQFLCYSLKIGAAVAMALFLVFMLPGEMPETKGVSAEITMQREESLGNKLKQGLWTMNRILNSMNLQLNGNNQRED